MLVARFKFNFAQLNLRRKKSSFEKIRDSQSWLSQSGHPGHDRRARSRGHLSLDPHPGAAHRGAAVQAARADAAANQSGKGACAQVVSSNL